MLGGATTVLRWLRSTWESFATRWPRWWSDREPLAVAVLVFVALVPVLVSAAALAGDVGQCRGLNIIELELAGTEERANELLESCIPEAEDGAGADLSARDLDGLRSGLHWDSWLFVPLYVVMLAFWCGVSHAFAPPRGKAGKGLLRLGIMAAVLAGVFDLVENHFLREVLADQPSSGSAAEIAFAAAVPKFVLVAFSGLVATGAVIHVWRRLRAPLDVAEGTYYKSSAAAAWDQGFDLPNRGDGALVGVACSGGGIRSGSFCMGALQSFTSRRWPGSDDSILQRTDRIASVSGGGYLAGARQLLVHQGRAQPFAAGSQEENHVRLHGRYLADSMGEWLAAVARLLSGLILNLGLLWLILYVIARPLGWAQNLLFAVSCDPDQPSVCIGETYDVGAQHYGAPGLAVGLATLLVVAFALGRFKGDTAVPFSKGDLVLRGAAAAAIGALGAAAVTLLVPAVAGAMRDLLELGTSAAADRRGALAGGTSIFAMVATGIRLLAARLASWKKTTEKEGSDAARGDVAGRTKRLAQSLAGVALAVLVLVLFAGFVQDARGGPRADTFLGWPDWKTWLVIVGVLLVLYARADQTTWSLHSLYRRRLNTAFAIDSTSSELKELDYSEPTTLSTMAKQVPGEPKLVICAAANVSGSGVAPPGRRAVTFTFEDDWIGGPQLGYTPTAEYEASLPAPVKGDVTLMAAMAISGAAVASAMGRHSKGSLNSLLAVFNVRLGVWLPTPTFGHQVTRRLERSLRVRRFPYLFREIFGLYDADEAYTYVTDGGHYENLGVVELLRRRCRVVLCLDASGGPATLVEAMQLAKTELGVEISFTNDDLESVRAQRADDGSDDPLAGRLAATAVIVGEISYPAVTGLGPDGSTSLGAAKGVIIYGRAVLTPETPPTVSRYACGKPRFPNDPTGDQWFDADQFDNYLLLGRHVGDLMATALGQRGVPT